MFKNHLKIAWRSLLKNKVFSVINIIGLCIGLCAAMIIGAIVYYDLSFDTFHNDKNRIYRVSSVITFGEDRFTNRGAALPLMQVLRDNAPEVELVVPTLNAYIQMVENHRTNAKFKNPTDVIFTDDTYFQLLKYPWLAGDQKTALSRPGQIVLTKEMAKKYFPNAQMQQILGQNLVYNDSIPLTVSGIVSRFTEKSDFTFKEFISLSSAQLFGKENVAYSSNWNDTSSDNQIFVKLKERGNKASLQSRLNALAAEHKNKADWATNFERSFKLQPLADFRFGAQLDVPPPGSVPYRSDVKVLMALGFVALFLLLLGCANFINLNSAQALTRAKDIGIRKTLGSSKKQVIQQFYYETLILTTIAALLSLLIAPLLLNQFQDQLPVGITMGVLYKWQGLLGIVALIFMVSLISGLYPAWVLSGFNPVSVLKGQMVKGTKGTRLRKGLTVFQFVVAQVFIIATLVVGKQLYFIMHKDMGFKTENIAYVHIPRPNNTPQVKKERLFGALKDIEGLSNISYGRATPASTNYWTTMLGHFDEQKEMFQDTQMLIGDLNYTKTYDIPLIAGRERLNDSIKEFVANEALVKALGYENPTDIIGTNLKYDTVNIQVVGVIANFNQHSLHSTIKPMVLTGDWSSNRYSNFTSVHFDLGDDSHQWSTSIKAIEKAWASIYPEEELEIHYMDNTIKGFYQKERRTVKLLQWATALAIIISCLGLLGLVIHGTERKTKEISIRKVLGASLAQLNMLLCKEFVLLVGIAFVIAVPLTWYGLNDWLQNFAFKTHLSWWVFISGGLGMLIIALMVVSIRTLSAARANPIKSLRTE